MMPRYRAAPILLLVALASCAAIDPDLYGARRAQVGGIQPTVQPPAPTAPGAPVPAPEGGDIRIPAPRGTLPTVSPDSVAVLIEKVGTTVHSASQASLAFRYASDKVVVATRPGQLARRNGLRIGVATGDLRLALGAGTQRGRQTSRESVFIAVQSGHEGQIAVGSEVMVQRLGYWTPYGDYRVLVERGFVGRSLVVRPRILPGGMVEIELWPRFTERGRRGAIDVTELATKVVVRDGQSLVIGGLTTGGSDVGAVLFGVGSRTLTHTMTVILTPRIGGMNIDWPKGKW